MDKNLDKLKDLIEKRKKRIKRSGGEIFTIWGLIILSSFLIKTFLVNSQWVSFFAMAAGIVIQIAYVKIRSRAEGLEMIWNNDLNFMWIYIIIIMIIAGLILPGYFKLYPPAAGSALMFFFAAPGAYITGLWIKKWSIKLSTVIFILASVLMVYPWPGNRVLVFPAAIILGMIVPGITSQFEGKYISD